MNTPEPGVIYQPVATFSCACGTTVSGSNDTVMELMTEHAELNCPHKHISPPDPWWSSVFDVWGLLIVAVIAAAVVQIVTGKAFW